MGAPLAAGWGEEMRLCWELSPKIFGWKRGQQSDLDQRENLLIPRFPFFFNKAGFPSTKFPVQTVSLRRVILETSRSLSFFPDRRRNDDFFLLVVSAFGCTNIG